MSNSSATDLVKGLSKQELKGLLADKKKQLNELLEEGQKARMSEDDRKAYAQSLIDKLFTTWERAGKWIRHQHEYGKEHCVVFGPTGQPRHLWGYLHGSRSVVAAMNRKGPNSIIQGHSSGIGYTATFNIARENWHTFVSKDIDIGLALVNMVHDSAPSEVNYIAAPVGLYLIEHGMTTLVARHYKKVYGMQTPIHHLIDVEMGLNEADLFEWKNQRFDAFIDNMEKIGKAGGFPKSDIKKCVYNAEQIAKVRIAELKKDPFDMTLERKTDWYLNNLKGLEEMRVKQKKDKKGKKGK